MNNILLYVVHSLSLKKPTWLKWNKKGVLLLCNVQWGTFVQETLNMWLFKLIYDGLSDQKSRFVSL